MATGWRQCRVCKKDKHITDFPKQKKSSKRCKTCGNCLNERRERLNMERLLIEASGDTKTCGSCVQDLPLSKFRKLSKSKYYASKCKECEKDPIGWKAAKLTGVNKPMDAKQTAHDLGAEAHRDLLVRFYLERRVT